MVKNIIQYYILICILAANIILAHDKAAFNSIKQNSGGYDASKFDNWLLVATFDSKDVGTFRFINVNIATNWRIKDHNRKEYIYDGEDTKAGIFAILNMTYYQYRGKNPLYSISSEYNNSDFVARFYFYKFTGKGLGILGLNNYLIAVDSHSKYIFAFAKPTSFKKMFGKNIPKSWGPVDDKYVNGKELYFFEYDPAGVVKPDGTCEIYDWFSDGLSKGKYEPLYSGKSPYIRQTK